MTDRIRTTVSLPPEVLEVFRTMADAAGVSVSRCMGDWLTDTADGAQLIAAKMQEARKAPVRVMQEMQAMLHGAHGEASAALDMLRQKGVRPDGPQARRAANPPPSNTGVNLTAERVIPRKCVYWNY